MARGRIQQALASIGEYRLYAADDGGVEAQHSGLGHRIRDWTGQPYQWPSVAAAREELQRAGPWTGTELIMQRGRLERTQRRRRPAGQGALFE